MYHYSKLWSTDNLKRSEWARAIRDTIHRPQLYGVVILTLPQAAQAEKCSRLEVAGVEGAQTRTRSGRQVQLTLRAKNQDY